MFIFCRDFLRWISSDGFPQMDFLRWIFSDGFSQMDFLRWIFSDGFSQMARELVRLGAEVDRVGSDGMTPLHYASRLQILTLHVFWVLVLGNNFLKKSS